MCFLLFENKFLQWSINVKSNFFRFFEMCSDRRKEIHWSIEKGVGHLIERRSIVGGWDRNQYRLASALGTYKHGKPLYHGERLHMCKLTQKFTRTRWRFTISSKKKLILFTLGCRILAKKYVFLREN